MIVLGIDSSADSASCCVCEDTKLLCEFTLNTGKTHSENLMSLIADVIETAGKKSEQIENIAVCSGPGSYTGLRIGAAVAKSIAHVNGCSISKISSLYAFAYPYLEFDGIIIPVINAGKDRVYAASYKLKKGSLLNQIKEEQYEIDRVIELAEEINNRNEKVYFVGSGAYMYADRIEIKTDFKVINNHSKTIKAYDLCRIAGEDTEKKSYCTCFDYVPYYINKTQAERNKENA